MLRISSKYFIVYICIYYSNYRDTFLELVVSQICLCSIADERAKAVQFMCLPLLRLWFLTLLLVAVVCCQLPYRSYTVSCTAICIYYSLEPHLGRDGWRNPGLQLTYIADHSLSHHAKTNYNLNCMHTDNRHAWEIGLLVSCVLLYRPWRILDNDVSLVCVGDAGCQPNVLGEGFELKHNDFGLENCLCGKWSQWAV